MMISSPLLEDLLTIQCDIATNQEIKCKSNTNCNMQTRVNSCLDLVTLCFWLCIWCPKNENFIWIICEWTLNISLFPWGNCCTEPSVYTAHSTGSGEKEAGLTSSWRNRVSELEVLWCDVLRRRSTSMAYTTLRGHQASPDLQYRTCQPLPAWFSKENKLCSQISRLIQTNIKSSDLVSLKNRESLGMMMWFWLGDRF